MPLSTYPWPEPDDPYLRTHRYRDVLGSVEHWIWEPDWHAWRLAERKARAAKEDGQVFVGPVMAQVVLKDLGSGEVLYAFEDTMVMAGDTLSWQYPLDGLTVVAALWVWS